jgi:hypothetical protein
MQTNHNNSSNSDNYDSQENHHYNRSNMGGENQYSGPRERRQNQNHQHYGFGPGFPFGSGGMTDMFSEMDNLFQDVFSHPFFTYG